MSDLLSFLLRERPAVAVAADLADWWKQTTFVRARFPVPVARALASGFVADRMGFAFAAGYEAALHALVPSLDGEAVASFCVTEETGNHPRAIRSQLTRVGDDFALSGSKRWSTMAPAADVLIVIASAGESSDGRPSLKAVRVEKRAPGLTVREMPPPPFVPEVLHAELSFEAVKIAAGDVLPGDGYTDYTKAFRTVEDIHVNAAVTGYLLSVAIRYGFPDAIRERLVALAASLSFVAPLAPSQPETHVALAGILAEAASIPADAEPSFSQVSDAERERWYRDRALVQVAGKARQQRRERAWETLMKEGRA